MKIERKKEIKTVRIKRYFFKVFNFNLIFLWYLYLINDRDLEDNGKKCLHIICIYCICIYNKNKSISVRHSRKKL